MGLSEVLSKDGRGCGFGGQLAAGPELSCPPVLSPSTHLSASPDLASFGAAASPPAPHLQGGLAPLLFCGVPSSQSHSEDFRSAEAKQPLCWRWGLPLQGVSSSLGPPPPSSPLGGCSGPDGTPPPPPPRRAPSVRQAGQRPLRRLSALGGPVDIRQPSSFMYGACSASGEVAAAGPHPRAGVAALGSGPARGWLACLLPTLV